MKLRLSLQSLPTPANDHDYHDDHDYLDDHAGYDNHDIDYVQEYDRERGNLHDQKNMYKRDQYHDHDHEHEHDHGGTDHAKDSGREGPRGSLP